MSANAKPSFISNGTITKDTMIKGTAAPMAVGSFRNGDNVQAALPWSAAEFERATAYFKRYLAEFEFKTGAPILVVSLYNECVQFLAFERALHALGLVLCPADASFFDAARTESILRRFDIAAVMGINGPVLDGLAELGHDIDKLFANRVVWARPDAYVRLQNAPGITLRRYLEIGPATAIECRAGQGVHVDHMEWDLQTRDGEIVLNDRLVRALQFTDFHSGVHGALSVDTCVCGSVDPRVLID